MAKIEDVAQRAGVSVTTVSRVLNNRGYISQKTRDNVNQAMKELNYQPNEMARALFRRKSNMIGLIIPEVFHPFFSEMAYYLEYYADQNEYKLLVCNSDRNITKEKKYIEILRKNQVDAIITGSSVLSVEHYSNVNLPMVSFDRNVAESIPVVTSDSLMGGKLATRLLLDKGCNNLVFISRGVGGPHHNALLASGRELGFEEGLRIAGIEPIRLQLESTAADNFNRVKEIVHFLQEHTEVDGIFASSDLIAAEVIQACHQLNKRIPEDIKIVGYDDVKLASILTPSLSTIRQPIREMSECMIDLIIRQLNMEKVPLMNVFPVSLIERGTT